MNIRFKTIKIENFMSFSSAELQLDNNGYVLVNGKNNNPKDMAYSNGSGKSTVWNALSWCICGETISGAKDIVNINNNSTACVELDFDIDNSSYKIIRTKPVEKSSTLKFYVDDNDVSGKGVRDTEKIISGYLPELNSLLIGSVIILGQGLPKSFTNNTPSGRKEVLENLSKSDYMIEDLKTRIKDRKIYLDDEIRKYEDNILKLNSQKSLLLNQINQAKESLNNMDSIDTVISTIESYEPYLIELNDRYESSQNQLKEIEQSIQDNKLSYQKIELSCSNDVFGVSNKYQVKKDELNSNKYSLTSEISSLKSEINKLKSINDICPTCGQKLPNVYIPDTTEQEFMLSTKKKELLKLEQELSNLMESEQTEKELIKSSYNDKLLEISNLISNLKNKYSKYSNESRDIYNGIVYYQEQLDSLTKERDSYNNKVEQYNSVIKENTKLVLEIDKQSEEYSSSLDSVKTHSNVVNKMNTIVTRDFRGYLLNNIIEFIQKRAIEYCKDVFETELLRIALDGNNISISYREKEFESLSGGEKQKVSLILQFALRDMLCCYLNFSSNILVLDEVVDFLDRQGADKIINLISTKLSDVTSIYFITHHDDLMFPCDKTITVIKDENDNSYIS